MLKKKGQIKILSPKQYGQSVVMTQTNRDLHMLVWSNMSAVWTYFSISEKDPQTAICKTCNGEISRGGVSAKTFSMSGLSPKIQTFWSLCWIWEERGTEKENASEHAHSVCGGRFWKSKEVSQWWCQGKWHYTKDYGIHCLKWSAILCRAAPHVLNEKRNRLHCNKAEKLLFIKKNLPLYLKK